MLEELRAANKELPEAVANGPTEAPRPILIHVSAASAAPAAVWLESLELKNRLRIREAICRYLIKALGCSTAGCFTLVVLQGFHPWGFQMDAALLKWLCGATIVKSGVLLAVFTNAVWRENEKRHRNHGKPPEISRKESGQNY